MRCKACGRKFGKKEPWGDHSEECIEIAKLRAGRKTTQTLVKLIPSDQYDREMKENEGRHCCEGVSATRGGSSAWDLMLRAERAEWRKRDGIEP